MFSYLPNFNIINGVPVDYMHGVLLGVTKALLNWWFNSKHSQEEWYCGATLSDIDKMLTKIKPPKTRVRLFLECQKYFWSLG